MTDAPTTTAPTGATLDLRRAQHAAAGVESWGSKGAALAALARLRDIGRNRDRHIEVHRAETHLWRFWVIGRPDHYNGVTYLMASGGRWVRGRLFDASPCFCRTACRRGHPAPWQPLAGELEPATVTHDYRYSAGSIGVVGHDGKPLMSGGWLDCPPVEVLSWTAFAWCVACVWKTVGGDEVSVRAAARGHRERPGGYPLRAAATALHGQDFAGVAG